MTYTAWSDGSFMKEGEAYIAYIIIDSRNRVVKRKKARVDGVNTSYESELAALYYLFKEISERKIKNINIYTDCLSLYHNLKRRKENQTELNKMMEKVLGRREKKRLTKSLSWESRTKNLAHFLFNSEKETGHITNFIEEFGHLEKTSKRYRKKNRAEYQKKIILKDQKMKLERMIRMGYLNIEVLDEEIKAPLKLLSFFKKIWNTKSQDELLETIEKKMKKMEVIKLEDGVRIFRKGRMDIIVRGNIMESVKIENGNLIEQYKRKDGNIFENLEIERMVKNGEKCKESIKINNFEYEISKKTLESLVKKMGGEIKAIESIKSLVNQGIVFEEEEIQILVKGRFHFIIKNNVIINYGIQATEYTRQWLERKKVS